jgi:DNA adenine methylase
MSGNKSKKIAFQYFGGKFHYLDLLYAYFPQHIHFIEVFCGSASVSINKRPSEIDTINDINSDVVNFFRVLREKPQELIDSLWLTPVSREEYNHCFYNKENAKSDVEKARSFFVRARQSFYGLGAQNKNKGWFSCKTKSYSKLGETVSKWINAVDKLYEITYRLKQIQIEHQSFEKIIEKMDFEGAFFYCDPPYPLESRASKNDYKHEFTNDDHRQLAEILHSIKGKAMVSGYECGLMNELYADWYLVKFPIKKNNIRSTEVQECIWTNYPPVKNRQLSLLN